MRNQQQGVTLIELMTALGVLAILAAVAVPSFREYTRNTRVTTAQNDLVTALSVARSESLRRSTPVAVCASTDGASCSVDDNWATGWIVFSDEGATAGQFDAGETLIQTWPSYPPELLLSGLDDLVSVRYLPSGMLDAAATVHLSVSTSGCTGEKARDIAVSVAGSPSSTKVNCS